ncbi:hypothetical protein AK88_05682, partial [Plasmodium fragile]
MRTTSSGARGKGGSSGGGGQAGQGAAAGGTPASTEQQECEGDKILQRPSNTLYVVPPNDNEWNKWKQVLEEFKEYMDEHNDLADAIGANCYNSGWNDFNDGKDYHTGQTVADVIRCRVMSVAWAFANGWHTGANATQAGVHMNEEEQNMFRCEVVNVFGHLLKKMYCTDKRGYKRGVEYSRIAFKSMKSAGTNGTGVLGGPVIDGKCTACGYTGYKRLARAINLPVLEWFLYDAHILQGIENIEGRAN